MSQAHGHCCEICGRMPAAVFTFRRGVGLVVFRRYIARSGVFCREHALGIGHHFQTKTLLEGWWGMISLFANVYYVARNLQALAAAKRLPSPAGAPVHADGWDLA